MTAVDIAGNSRGGRRIKRLAVAVVAFLVIYTIGWFLTARSIEHRLTAFLSEQYDGTSGECENMNVSGFPFRIGVFCSALRFDNAGIGASAAFGALRSAAQVYQPGRGVIELDGPAEIRVSPDISLSADWALLHASAQLGFRGLSRTSMTYDKFAGTLRIPATGDVVSLSADHGEVHLRRNGPDLDAASSVENLMLAPADGDFVVPAVSASSDITLTDQAGLLDAGAFNEESLRNTRGEMRNLTLDLGGGMVATASGPFSVDAEGLISGKFRVTMQDVEGWRKNLVKTFPDDSSLIDNIANMLTALSSGRNEASVTLNVRDGTAFLAFFPIGELPRL